MIRARFAAALPLAAASFASLAACNALLGIHELDASGGSGGAGNQTGTGGMGTSTSGHATSATSTSGSSTTGSGSGAGGGGTGGHTNVDASDDAAGSGHTLYVIGGGPGNWGLGVPQGTPPSIPDVIAAPIHADGTLGAWTSRPALPDPYVHGNPAVLASHFAIIPGEFGTPSSGANTNVLFADLTGSGQWQSTTMLPSAHGGWESAYGAASDGTWVWVLGDGAAVSQTKVIPSGGVEAWTSAPSLPLPMSDGRAVLNAGFLYALGSVPLDAGNSNLSILYAAVAPEAGLMAWQNPGVSTTSAGFFAVTVLNSYLYVLGGTDGQLDPLTSVSISALAANGTPGAFQPGAPMPDGRSNACAAAGPNAVYVIGGDPGHGSTMAYDTVFMAVPAPDGSIGSWQTTTSLPSARSGVACVVY